MSRFASSHEEAEKAGMANFTMRLLSAGTERHSEEEIADNLERNGAHFKSEAGKDWSTVDLLTTTHCLHEDLETVLELMECPIFPPEKLAREREIIRMNIREQEDSRLTYTMRRFNKHFYGAHPYSWPNLGLLETIDNIQRGDLVPCAHTAFEPSNLVVSAVGGRDDGVVQNILRESLAARSVRKSAAITKPPSAVPAFEKDQEFVEHRESEAEYLVLGYPGPSIREPEAVTFRFIGALLGGSMDSRLFREIRDKRGLCYQIGSGYTTQMGLSPLLIYTVTSPANRKEAVRCAEAEIARLKEEPVSEEELERVKTFVCGTYIMAMETNMGQTARFAAYEIAGLGWDYTNKFPDDISAITAEDIMETTRRYLTHRLLTITAPNEK